MAEIRPFKGTRYNQKIIQNLAKVICPPYDIISPEQQDVLYDKNEHNFVRIEYNRETPGDTSSDNRYTRAAANIRDWINKNILKTDTEPAFYIHKHSFNWQGKKYTRHNILALVKLEEWGTKIIRPHENIIPKAKSDRMNMLKTCQANTSTVLSMYSDPDRIISNIFKDLEKKPSTIDVIDDVGERHIVWAVINPVVIYQIQRVIAEQPLYIADGHHRYDSALTFRREKIVQSTGVTGNEGFNYVMMNIFDSNDPGLVISPTHRLLRGVSDEVMRNLKSKLNTLFDIEELPLSVPEFWEKVDVLLDSRRLENKQIRLAVYGLVPGMMLILSLKSQQAVECFMPAGSSAVYKKLDVSIVDHVILEKLIGFVKDSEAMTLEYDHDRLETIRKVDNGQFQLAFILGPVNPDSIKQIADIGDRMPRKSTYFYPKAPAGLVFYRW
jgi:uncharacterized protein (DUF1015 family)